MKKYMLLAAAAALVLSAPAALACVGGNACYQPPAASNNLSAAANVTWSGMNATQGQTFGRGGSVESVAKDMFNVSVVGGLSGNACPGGCEQVGLSVGFESRQFSSTFAHGFDYGSGPRAAGALAESIGHVHINAGGHLGF